jgi:hypothetical protein
MITALIVAAMIGQAPQPAPPAKPDAQPAAAKARPKKAGARNVEVLIDPNWVPTPGDRVEVIIDGALGCTNLRLLEEALNTIQAGDRVGVDQLVRSKRADLLVKGTKVLVIANTRPPTLDEPARILSATQFARETLTRAATPPPDFRRFPVEVRILSGPLVGEKRYVPEMWLAKPITDPMAVPRRSKPRLVQQPAAKPGAAKIDRAATLLQSARNLEKSGKLDGAAKFYRQVIKDFPDSAEAKTAAEKLRSLEQK